MKKSTKLRQLLNERRAVMAVGAHDVLSAKLIQKAGFEIVQASGFGLAATVLGLPDMAFLSFGEMLELTRNIANAVDIPLMADADTGFGNAINAMFVIRKYIEAGCAGMNIEDQAFPKRCGHLEGKTIIPADEMVLKIKACKEVRDKLDPDFIINARTDAIAVEGIDKAIERANAYLDAGADMIFVEAPRHVEDIKRAVKEIHGLVSINFFDAVVGGKTPLFPYEEAKKLGIARISVPVGPLFAAVKGMSTYLKAVKDGTSEGKTDLVVPFADYKNLVGFNDFRELEKKYLPKFVDNNR
ncbi:MAG: oxaloacetate decarboxylase [Pyramidobacter sp.]|jgi:methylisocitrate lyase